MRSKFVPWPTVVGYGYEVLLPDFSEHLSVMQNQISGGITISSIHIQIEALLWYKLVNPVPKVVVQTL